MNRTEFELGSVQSNPRYNVVVFIRMINQRNFSLREFLNKLHDELITVYMNYLYFYVIYIMLFGQINKFKIVLVFN